MPCDAPDDKSSFVLIAIVLLLFFVVFCYLLRTIVKLLRQAPFTVKDDFLLGLALLLAIAQSIVQCLRTTTGLGRPVLGLLQSDVYMALKLELTGYILYILGLTVAKASTAMMLAHISRYRSHCVAAWSICGFVTVHATVSILVLGFQCSLPQSWNYIDGACVDRVTFWTAFDVTNCVAEVFLILLPVYLIQSVQMTAAVKRRFVCLFAARLLTIGALITDAVIWNAAVRGFSPEQTFFEEWKTCVTMQVVQTCCFFATCAVFIGRFFHVMQTGWGLDVTIQTTAPMELVATRSYEQSRPKLLSGAPQSL